MSNVNNMSNMNNMNEQSHDSRFNVNMNYNNNNNLHESSEYDRREEDQLMEQVVFELQNQKNKN